jgi:membrane protease YdiL (CAAX protease family)
VFTVLRPEPVGIGWAIKLAKLGAPLRPLPPDLRERSERNYNYLLYLTYALVCSCLCFLMLRYSVPSETVGLHLNKWGRSLGLGAAVAAAYVGWLRLAGTVTAMLARRTAAAGQKPPPYRGPDYLTRGSAWFWILTDVVGCFVEEFWRAFCLVSLEDIHHGTASAVVATSLAFALAHYRGGQSAALEFGWLLGHATFGLVFAVVFLWSGSIVPTYTGHLLTNFVALYRARRGRDSLPK